ncbi:MAG TPA: DUF6515 family protein [Pedobacter sp.]
MKTLNLKSVVIVASLMISGMVAGSAFAQGRSSHGGGGGGFHGGGGGGSHVGGGGFHGGGGRTSGSVGARGNFSRGSVGVRAGVGVRGGFRGGAGFRGGYRGGRPGYYGHGFGRPYYGYYNFYRPYLGFSLSILPFGYYPFFYGDAQYYYSGGLYYRQYDDEYKVVVPPVGAEVPSIPTDASEVTVNGQTYYEYKGVYYSPVEKADGKTAYIIAGKDGVLNTGDGDVSAGSGVKLGDIVTSLPEGAREVNVKGQKLYVSEDGVYYEEVQSGDQITYKVVGI